jgi:hypothetical protein
VIGRWASDTWTIYLRHYPAVAAAVQRVDLAPADRCLAYFSPSFLTASHSVPKRLVMVNGRLRGTTRGRNLM